MIENYDIYCEFDPKKHKEKYNHYLEVVIEEDGHVIYAVPSHQEKLISLSCKKLGISRYELEKRCPKEYYFNFITWLSMQSGAIAVWEDYYIGSEVTKKQALKLKQLKLYGLYTGRLPHNCEKNLRNSPQI